MRTDTLTSRAAPGAFGSAALWTLVLAASAVRLAVANSLPLLDDEAYYWVWSRHLAWGYLDHPPLIAAATAASRWLFGDSPLAIRLPSLAFATGTAMLVHRITLDVSGDSRRAFLAAALFHAVPVFFAGGVIAAPDAPLSFFWMLAAWSLWHALQGRLAAWLLFGAAVGLGLQAKHSMALLLPGAIVLASANSALRRSVYPHAAALVALVLFGPNLLWNAHNDWATLRYVYDRAWWIAPRDPLANLAIYAGVTLLYLSPVLGVLLVVAPWRIRRTEPGGFLLWLALPTLVAVLLSALAAKAKPHYAVPFALLGVPALALWEGRRVERLRATGIWVGGVMTLLAALAATAGPLVDPRILADQRGWDRVAVRIEDAFPDGTIPLIGTTYQNASQIAYATRGKYPVSVLPGAHAFDQWSPLENFRGRDVVIVHDDRSPPEVPYEWLCRRSVPLSPVVLVERGQAVRRFAVVCCLGLRVEAQPGRVR